MSNEGMGPQYSEITRHSLDMGDEEMGMRWRRVLAQKDFQRGSQIAEVSAKSAMASLLGHIRVDQDGGLLNLTSDAEPGSQYTKLHILFKTSALRSAVGCMLVMRLLINVPYVFNSSIHDLYCYFSQQCGPFSRMELVDNCALPLVSMSVAVAAFEVVFLSSLVLVFLKNVLTFVGTSDRGSATDGLAKRRYCVLSNIFLEGMTQLQGFSALRCLENVHPGCITHFAKGLTVCDAAARAIFERLLGRKDDDISDDDLHDMIMQVMVRAVKTNEEQEELVRRCSLLSSYGLFKELRNLPALPQKDQDGGAVFVDPEALNNHGWKVRVVAFLESFLFVASCFVLAVFGSSAFVVKLVHVSDIMMDSDAKLCQIVFSILVFLNQCVSIVAVQPLLRERIFCFLFGGQDANVSNEEKHLMIAYQAILAEKIWRAHSYEASYIRKCLTLLTLSDDDIQRLTLEETTQAKTMVTRAVFKQAKEDNLESTNWMELCCEPIMQSIHGGPDDGSSYTQMHAEALV